MSNKFKIAMVTAYPKEDGVINGGVEGVAYNLVQGMKRKPELEINIIAPGDRKSTYIEQRDGITIHWIKKSFLPGFLSYWTIDRLRIQKILNSINPDIVHFQGLTGWSIGCKNKYIITIHGIIERDVLFKGKVSSFIRHKVLSLVENYSRVRARNIIIINPYVSELLGHVIKGKTWEIPNPIFEGYFDNPRSVNEKNILYIGRISELKNIIDILLIFKQVLEIEPETKLDLVGTYESKYYYEKCLSLVKELKIDKSVDFKGAKDVDELLGLYSRARVLLLMSKQEVAPMVVTEAMANGVPVVANNICGIKYMIEHDVTGYKYNDLNKNEIVSKICELLSDDELNQRVSIKAKEYALKYYSVDNVVDNTLSAYREIINE